MLKADLHIHTHEDPHDGLWLSYTARQIIDRAAGLGYDVLAFTQHGKVTCSDKLASYAKSRGILLIPGAELRIAEGDVLAYNVTQEEVDSIKSLEDIRKLRKAKKGRVLIIAPHPFLPSGHSLGSNLEKNIDLFDAVEFCHLYTKHITWNRKAASVSNKYGKALIGTSDCHIFDEFGTTCTLIDSRKDIALIFEAIRKRRVQLKTMSLSLFFCLRILLNFFSIRYGLANGWLQGKVYK